MYIPKINLSTDRDEIVAFMKRFGFATIVTAKDGLPVATHLPFIVSADDGRIILSSHFARANGQWADIEGNKVLVIFSEPHAYISPKNYDRELSVPTWNYISVHAYGEGRLLGNEDAFRVLGRTIDFYESSYRSQWEGFPEAYRQKMVNGIVAFEIHVTEVQAKKKLSQNRTDTEKARIIDTLSHSTDTNEQLIAEYMKAMKPNE